MFNEIVLRVASLFLCVSLLPKGTEYVQCIMEKGPLN